MTQFSDIIVTPIYGPLSTNNAPCAMPPHNSGVLVGIHPNPPQFYPADGASQFSNARHEYARAQPRQVNNPYAHATKYIAPACSSLYISARKRAAIGKSSYKQGLPASAPLSYKNYNQNDVKNALRYTRAGGCTAPAKKGSIYNYSLRNGQVCSWGSLPRQNY